MCSIENGVKKQLKGLAFVQLYNIKLHNRALFSSQSTRVHCPRGKTAHSAIRLNDAFPNVKQENS